MLFAAAHVFLAGPSRRSRRRAPLSRVIPRGCVFRRGGYGRPLSSTILRLVFGSGHRDPKDRCYLAGGRLLSLPGPFSHARFVFSLPQVFFFWAFEAPTGQRDGDVYIYMCVYIYTHIYTSISLYIYIYSSENGICSPRTECRAPRAVPRIPRNSQRAPSAKLLSKMLPLVVVA